MDLEIEPKNIDNIESTSVLQQTSYWAKVKQRQGYKPRAFDIKLKSGKLEIKRDTDKDLSYATDDILILLYRLNETHQLAYVPYGPILEPKQEMQGAYLEELSEMLRNYLPYQCIAVRYDLRWESHWANDESRYDREKKWIGPPESAIQEIRINFNTIYRNLRKTITDNLPSNTVFLNLKRSQEVILMAMKPKTRYNIRLSQRKGVIVREAEEHELDIWYEMYTQTAARNGILLHDIGFFKSVLTACKDYSGSNTGVHLLLAQHDGIPLAGMFLVVSGNRATYLYGASSDFKRNYMATYSLQWYAIRKAKSLGCLEYDMFGVSRADNKSHPLHGLYRFKTGFGGRLFHRLGCWDYPFLEKEYETFRTSELNCSGYHLR